MSGRSLEKEAVEKKIPLLKHIVEKQRINFQSYDDARDAYSVGYKLHFHELNNDSSKIATLKQAIQFRHRIVHVTPLLSVLNPADLPARKAVIPTKEYRQEIIALFDLFIRNLHKKSLELLHGNSGQTTTPTSK